MKSSGNGVFTRVVKTGQEDGETLLGSRGIRFSENLDDTCVREPIGDGGASSETLSKLGTRDIGGRGALGDLIDRLVLVRTGEVGHGLEGNHLDLKLILELGNELLGVVRTIEVLTLRVLTGTGVVSTDNEVGRTKVLSDNGVPDSLPGTSHPHSEGQESKVGHTLGIRGHESLVSSDTSVVINISGLGKTDNGVDEDVCSSLTGSSDGELSVGTVHRVSGLESDNLAPGELVEVSSELGGSVSKGNVVKVSRSLDSLDLTADVKLLNVVAEVCDGRVGDVVSTHDLFSLGGLVRSVDVRDFNRWSEFSPMFSAI